MRTTTSHKHGSIHHDRYFADLETATRMGLPLLGLSLVILDNNRGEGVAHSCIEVSSGHESSDTALTRRIRSEVRSGTEIHFRTSYIMYTWTGEYAYPDNVFIPGRLNTNCTSRSC